jgi:hypothetical protein
MLAIVALSVWSPIGVVPPPVGIVVVVVEVVVDVVVDVDVVVEDVVVAPGADVVVAGGAVVVEEPPPGSTGGVQAAATNAAPKTATTKNERVRTLDDRMGEAPIRLHPRIPPRSSRAAVTSATRRVHQPGRNPSGRHRRIRTSGAARSGGSEATSFG